MSLHLSDGSLYCGSQEIGYCRTDEGNLSIETITEEDRMKKCIVTVLGRDTVGIVAKVCTYLADNKINILDISQTIVQGYFNMMVIADITELEKDFTVLCDELERLGQEIGVNIHCQRTEILRKCTGCRRVMLYDQYV